MSYSRFPLEIQLPLTSSRLMVTDTQGLPTTDAVTSTEASYVSGVTSGIQTQITGITPQTIAINKWVFVSEYGNDTTGDGTYNKPYATTTKALSVITTAASANRYGVHIRGTISESTIYLKPYVWYFGDTWGSSRLNATSTNAIQLSPGAFTTGNSRCGMTNVYMTGSTGISLDFIGQTASGSHVVEMDNLGVNGNVVISSNNTNQYFQWRSALCFGDVTFHGCLGFFFDTFVAGNFLVDNGTSSIAGAGLNVLNSFIGGNVTVTGDGSHANPLQFSASTISGATTVTGAGSTLYVDSISLSTKANVSISSGGALVRTSDVYAIGYTPTTSANWASLPDNAQSAMDSLAAITRFAPSWTKYSITHTALQAAALTNDIQLFSLPTKTVVHKIIIKNTTAFAGTTTYTLSVGITGNLTKYIAAFDVKQAVADTTFGVPAATIVETPENFGSATSIRVSAISTVQNLNQSSAGAADIYVLTSLLP